MLVGIADNVKRGYRSTADMWKNASASQLADKSFPSH